MFKIKYLKVLYLLIHYGQNVDSRVLSYENNIYLIETKSFFNIEMKYSTFFLQISFHFLNFCALRIFLISSRIEIVFQVTEFTMN